MDVKIVPYKTGNYQTLIDIWETAGLPYKPLGRDSEKSIEAELKKGVGKFLFAVIGNVYAGVVLVTHDGRKGWINRVAVLPEYRHKGIAKLLVDAAEKWLDEQGISIYACQIEDYNEDSLKVFKKLGYIPFKGMHYLTKRKYPEI
ncbi:MAG: GNAT family N-acetyltransferase [Bacteroidetes bacterium]|nr:GNAT family N-acetyltransferase [Bacteroidota bacterium]